MMIREINHYGILLLIALYFPLSFSLSFSLSLSFSISFSLFNFHMVSVPIAFDFVFVKKRLVQFVTSAFVIAVAILVRLLCVTKNCFYVSFVLRLTFLISLPSSLYHSPLSCPRYL